MKDILLKTDGSINKKEIDKYIKKYGIDTPYDNQKSKYHNQTLLAVGVSSNEIPVKTKLELVSYLINKGANANNPVTKLNGGLVAIAISQQNLELATLLVKAGANPRDTYNNKNLLDIALDLKNEQILLWILKNAKSLLLKLKTSQFNGYLQKIARLFPNYLQSELCEHFKKIAEEKINYNFSVLGLIDNHDTALILAAKMTTKTYKNSIFVITNADIPQLIKEIKNLIENDINNHVIKFQIIYFDEGHVIFGEFEIDKRNNPVTVKYLHCDPLPGMTKFFEIITPDFRKQILPIANIEIYDSNATIQKGLGCSYFSIDGALMLATPPDRDYVTNVMEYIKKHGEKKDIEFEGKNISYIQSSTLPTRFIRGLQYFKDSLLNCIKGLDSLVFNTTEKNTIVNKKKETAEISIRKDLKEFEHILSRELRIHNMRAERKMKQYGNAVSNFVKDKNILAPEFHNLLDQYRIKGLTQFCEEKVEKKTEKKIKL